MAFAAIVHEEGHQVRQRRENRAVDDRPSLATAHHQTSLFKLAKVKGQARGRRAAQLLADRASRAAVCACYDQQPNNAQPGRIRDGGERCQRLILIHGQPNGSTLFEM